MAALAYRWLPSFRREHGGLYALYVAIYHPTYVATMKALHRAGRHGRPMASGRCTWCGAKCAEPYGIVPDTACGANMAAN